MTELSWGKTADSAAAQKSRSGERLKFIIGGALLLGAVVFLIVSGTMSGARYFITVNDLLTSPEEYIGQSVRISGAVDGTTIVYDSTNLIIDFTIADIPEDTTDLALTLHEAVNDPTAARISVHIENQVKPDLLQHEAQAILTGVLQPDGTFVATELLLKCPSRYEESVPDQVEETGV